MNLIMKYNIKHLFTRSWTLPVVLQIVFCCVSSVTSVGKDKMGNPSVVDESKTIIKADGPSLKIALNGIVSSNVWNIDASINPDVLTTTAGCVTFMSGIDTLTVNIDEWSHKDITVMAIDGDSAHVRINRHAANPYENPNPELLKRAPSGLLSPEQAKFDLDALFYTISEVHPNMYSVTGQVSLLSAINQASESITDSISIEELYKIAAPVVAMIGDGHTNLFFPANSVFKRDTKRLPVWMHVESDRTITTDRSLDSIMPQGTKVLKINGRTAKQIIDELLPYVSGETEHFRLSRLDDLRPLIHMSMPAESYEFEYVAPGDNNVYSATFPALAPDEYMSRVPALKNNNNSNEPYTFHIDETEQVGIMDFRSFRDQEKMKEFADSMFTTLRERGIRDLIIDIRENGGGASSVGDILLQYFTPRPFIQMEKTLIRITPTTQRLMWYGDMTPGIYYIATTEDNFHKPLSREEGFYDGKVWLLTSNKTFSSAGSFAWAAQVFGAATLIGEETGGMNVSYGDVLGYNLPVSGITCGISYKRFWKHNADENDIHGTIPEYQVPKEQAMKMALQLIRDERQRK